MKSNWLFLLENACVVCFLVPVTAIMVLISGSVDFARFAHANQHSSIPSFCHRRLASMNYLPSDFPGRLASGGTSGKGDGLAMVALYCRVRDYQRKL